MAINKKKGIKERNFSIKLESEKNLLNLFFKKQFAIVKSPVVDELIRDTHIKRSLEPQIKQMIMLKQLLNPEKIKILYTIKHSKPSSIYELAKLLKRDLKAVRQDLKVLKEGSFIEIEKTKVKNRWHSKPILSCEKINFSIEI
jgi:DNA-binding transcriptional ArsR family regulator